MRYIAKNIVLAGVKSATIFDPEPVSLRDLGTQVRSMRLQLTLAHYPHYSFFFARVISERAELKQLFTVSPN